MNNPTATSLPAIHAFKRPLKLPNTTEEWAEADYLLQTEVVPTILQAHSAENKNNLLCTVKYKVLAARFGV